MEEIWKKDVRASRIANWVIGLSRPTS